MNKSRHLFEKQIPRADSLSFLFLAPFSVFWRSLVNHLIWESSSRQRKKHLEQCWFDAPAAGSSGSGSSGSNQGHLVAALKLFQQTMTCKPEPEDWKNAASAYSRTWYELTVGQSSENHVQPSSAKLPQQ